MAANNRLFQCLQLIAETPRYNFQYGIPSLDNTRFLPFTSL